MAKLTVKELEALRSNDAGRKLREDGGLVGTVRARAEGVSVKWDWRYRFAGKVRQLAIGTWPKDSMPDIRRERDRLAAILKEGKDPADEKRALRLQARADQAEAIAREHTRIEEAEALKARLTVRELFERWARLELSGRKDGGKEGRRSFEKDVLPTLGNLPAEEVRRAHIARILDSVVERGARIGARNLLGDIRQMYGFAIARGLLENDPTSHMKRDDFGRKVERARVLSEAEIRQLAKQLPQADMREASVHAIWIMLATCCRIGELAQARWADVDLENGAWRIPPENSKNAKAHTVALSGFALTHFRALRTLADSDAKRFDRPASPWVLPAKHNDGCVCTKSLNKQISDRQRGNKAPMANRTPHTEALMLPGGKWTPHDLRRTGATMMVALGVLPEVVERCLNHVEQNRVKRIYQRHSYEAEMKHAWRLLGERLELLARTDEANVVTLTRGVA